LLALSDSNLLAAGVSALSHRKLVLARVETLKLLPNQEEALLAWAQGARSGGAMHSLLGSFAMDSLPPLVSVPQRAQEFQKVEKFKRMCWYVLE
jgi:hypothetical protein